MLALPFVLIITFSVTSGENELCQKEIFETCDPDDTISLAFPKTEEEVDNSCSIMLPYVACIKEYTEHCDPGVVFTPSVDKTQELVMEICRKDSYIYSAIVANIGCMSNVLDYSNETCFNEIESGVEKFSEHLKEFYPFDVDYHKYFVRHCFRELYAFTCFTANVLKSCGLIPADVVVEILQKSETVTGFCHGQPLKAMRSYVKSMDSTNPEKSIMEKLLHSQEDDALSFDFPF